MEQLIGTLWDTVLHLSYGNVKLISALSHSHFPTVRSTSKICEANSRVGVIIIAPKPALRSHRARKRFSSSCTRDTDIYWKVWIHEKHMTLTNEAIQQLLTGTKYANVLPLPVSASPIISRPANECGIDNA